MSDKPDMTPTDSDGVQANNTNRNNRRGNYRRSEAGHVGSEMRAFEGKTSELNGVLGLLTENLNHGVTFDVFQERVKNYILKNYKYAEDIIVLVTD